MIRRNHAAEKIMIKIMQTIEKYKNTISIVGNVDGTIEEFRQWTY